MAEKLHNEREIKNNPSFCEGLGIWAANRLLKYLDTLGPSSQKVKPVELVGKKRGGARWRKGDIGSYVASASIVVGGIIFAWYALASNVREATQAHPFPGYRSPSVTLGLEQNNPNRLIQTLDRKGSGAIFPYGVVINDVDGLSFQVDAQGLGELVKEADLMPPNRTIVTTYITNGGDPDPSLFIRAQRLYESVQGKDIFIMTTAPLSLSTVKEALAGTHSDQDRLANVEFTIRFLEVMKRQRGLLQSGVIDNSPLTRVEFEAVARRSIQPFRILRLP